MNTSLYLSKWPVYYILNCHILVFAVAQSCINYFPGFGAATFSALEGIGHMKLASM